MAVTFTPQAWCFTEFFWHTSHQGANTYYLPWGTRTGHLPWTTRISATPSSTALSPRSLAGVSAGVDTIISVKTVVVVDTTVAHPTPPPTTLLRVRQNTQPHECYPENIAYVFSSGACPSGWTFAATDSPTWICCPFAYTLARTRTINRSTFINTTRCVSTFGLGSEQYRPLITIIKEIDTWGQLSDMTGTTTFGADLDVWASTPWHLYAEATPYRVLAPAQSDKTGAGGGGKPTETQPPAPGGEPVAGSSAFSPGAAAGIAIGVILLLGVAGFFLWRRLRNRKKAGHRSGILGAGGTNGMAGPRMADCDDKEVVTDTSTTPKPPPYELDISVPVMVPVEADHGREVHHGQEDDHSHHDVPTLAVTSVPELGGTAVERGTTDKGPVQAPATTGWSDSGPSRSGAVSPEVGGREVVQAGEMSPATTFAMSSDSRPTSVLPEGANWRDTARVSYLQRELKKIRVERERLQQMAALDEREAELERLVLEEMKTLKEG